MLDEMHPKGSAGVGNAALSLSAQEEMPTKATPLPPAVPTDNERVWAYSYVMVMAGRDHGELLAQFRSAIETVGARERQLSDALAQLAARDEELAKEEKAHHQTLVERDEAQDAMGDAYCFVTGKFPEWSNLFGYAEATNHIAEVVKQLKGDAAKARVELEAAEKQLRGIEIAVGHSATSSRLVYTTVIERITTARAGALHEALEAVRGERLGHHDQMINVGAGNASDISDEGYSNGIADAERAILAKLVETKGTT